MADEASIRSSMIIKKGSLDYNSKPTYFTADVSSAVAPTPGGITVSTAGTDVVLTELTTPGLCRLMNLDTTNYVQVGLYDPETVKFYPLLELMPGESYIVRLSRDIQWEYGTGAGTGTTGAETNILRLKAIGGNCECIVEAFEK